MERVRVEEFGESKDEIVDESILFFSRVYLKILSESFLQYMGIRCIYTVCLKCERSVSPKQSSLAT